jgi:glycosyltransferase involved in cell wall biosynthesis
MSGRPHSSAYIRLLQPLKSLNLDACYEVTASLELPAEKIDVAIVDRLWKGWGCEQSIHSLLDQLRRRGIKLIHAIDDNLYDIHSEPANWRYRSDLIRLLSASADRVVVTTKMLAERVQSINRDVDIVPNVVDEALFQKVPNDRVQFGSDLVVGYMGSFTHADDLKTICPALKALTQSGLKVRLQVIGGGDPAALAAIFGEMLDYVSPPIGYDYPEFVSWMARHSDWQIAVGPLEQTRFNSYKSDIKWLDYSMLGVAGVYSDVPAYKETIDDGRTGLLAAPHSDSWFQSIKLLAGNADLRNSIVANAKREIHSSRLVAHAAQRWQVVFGKIL